jgi:protease I
MLKVLIPLPSHDFDPTEVAVPWKTLKKNKIDVIFATPEGKRASADPIMIHGEGLGLLKTFLVARTDAQAAYKELLLEPSFLHPLSYEQIQEENFQGLLLPGGHAQGMKTYLESSLLQTKLLPFFENAKAIGAICHGVVLASRIKNKNNFSVLRNKKVTALLKSSERLAYTLTKENLGTYYLTYPDLTVEDEVKAALENNSQFIKGPPVLLRDSERFLIWGFCVVDGNFVSARWPGDVYNFTKAFLKILCRTH